MSIFIDRSFLLRVSAKLPKFTQKKPDLYNFRCPICGDSHKNKAKARGYVYAKKGNYFFMCHNCGASMSFYNFLDKVDSSILKEYALERYKNGEDGKANYEKPSFDELKEKPVFKTKTKINLPSIAELPDEHFAKVYVINRKIPEKYHQDLYFTDDFKKFVEVDLKIEKDGLKEDDPRLVIPFYNEEKTLVSFQGRALGESKLRYITVKLDENNHKVFGLDKVILDDEEKDVYVTEGPIDSMFLENAIATADSNLKSADRVINKTKLVLVFDNEPRNKDICRMMEQAIEEHYKIVIWPEMIEEKDINEMILSGFSSDEIQDIIIKNTFQNLRAKMEFINWKKV
jgi:transcription elongation factor Elf1